MYETTSQQSSNLSSIGEYFEASLRSYLRLTCLQKVWGSQVKLRRSQVYVLCFWSTVFQQRLTWCLSRETITLEAFQTPMPHLHIDQTSKVMETQCNK